MRKHTKYNAAYVKRIQKIHNKKYFCESFSNRWKSNLIVWYIISQYFPFVQDKSRLRNVSYIMQSEKQMHRNVNARRHDVQSYQLLNYFDNHNNIYNIFYLSTYIMYEIFISPFPIFFKLFLIKNFIQKLTKLDTKIIWYIYGSILKIIWYIWINFNFLKLQNWCTKIYNFYICNWYEKNWATFSI